MKRVLDHLRFCSEDRFKEEAFPSLDHTILIEVEILYKGEPRFRENLPGPSILTDEDDE